MYGAIVYQTSYHPSNIRHVLITPRARLVRRTRLDYDLRLN